MERISDFDALNAQVLGISTDNIHSIDGWCTEPGGLSYPVLSDFWPHGQVAPPPILSRRSDHLLLRGRIGCWGENPLFLQKESWAAGAKCLTWSGGSI